MASSNKDETMENDTDMSKQPEKPKTILIKCFNEFQEKLNQTQIPPPPWINSAHDHKYVLEVHFFSTSKMIKLLFLLLGNQNWVIIYWMK
jgi:hypothetical protein